MFEFVTDGNPRTPLPSNEDELIPNTGQATREQIHRYQRCIGSLMYLMMGTCPDIAYAIGKLSRFASNPSDAHFAALNCTLYYINSTNHFYLKYIQRNKGSAINPEGYVNSDYCQECYKNSALFAQFLSYPHNLWIVILFSSPLLC